jgi:hypothetical protein
MTDGIYKDISIEDYHANKTHISATQIKYAKKSLKHFYSYVNGFLEKPSGSHMDFGNAFELALLNPVGYMQEVAVIPDQDFIDLARQDNPALTVPRNSKIYKAGIAEFERLNPGKYHIMDQGKESFDAIEEMLSNCMQDAVIQALIKNVEYQLSLFWTDPETGIKLKTRPDICKRKKNVIVNLKTTEDGSPQAFSKDLCKYEYPLQACVEIDGCLKTGLMEQVDSYFWLVVEKVPPYNATIYEFSGSDREACMDNYRFTLKRIQKAREQEKWPGYGQNSDNEYGILKATIPLWYNF